MLILTLFSNPLVSIFTHIPHKYAVSFFEHENRLFSYVSAFFGIDFFGSKSYNADMNTTEIINSLRDENRKDFPKEIFANEQVDFVGHIERLLSERGLTIADIVPHMDYERSYVYHMLNGSRAPSRTFLLRLAIILKLDYEETQRILYITGNPLLYAKIEFDAVIIYALERHMDPVGLNNLLESVKEPLLFWTRHEV